MFSSATYTLTGHSGGTDGTATLYFEDGTNSYDTNTEAIRTELAAIADHPDEEPVRQPRLDRRKVRVKQSQRVAPPRAAARYSRRENTGTRNWRKRQ